MRSSATIKWNPVPQSLSMWTATFAEPAGPTLMMEEPPSRWIGSWISCVRATLVEGVKFLIDNRIVVVLIGATFVESVSVGRPPCVLAAWRGWFKATPIRIPSIAKATKAKIASAIKAMRMWGARLLRGIGCGAVGTPSARARRISSSSMRADSALLGKWRAMRGSVRSSQISFSLSSVSASSQGQRSGKLG